MIERAFPPAFPLRLAAKDLRLVEDAAARHELELPLRRRDRRALRRGRRARQRRPRHGRDVPDRGALGGGRLAAAPAADGLLDLDVPRLLEAAHRERDQQQLERHEQRRQEPNDVGRDRRVGEAVLVALEPAGHGDQRRR